MNAKAIIELNNEKREQLNEENLKYYEDMLVYIRLNTNKSEQQTEEVLLELLEHILQAQEEGRTAEEIFGKDPKTYCKEIIGEIPVENRKRQILFISSIILQFLAIISLTHGIIGFGLHYFFDLGSANTTFSIGSGIAILIIDVLIAFLFIIIIFKWLKNTVFKDDKKQKKWVEFLQVWAFSTFSIGLFVLVIYLMPNFGTTVSIPTIYFAGLGVFLYLVSFLIERKKRSIQLR
ncbi:Uncharacterized membrane-anchored protein [Virgibacillus subterraneus]|uniref:Uncharacterized membrane-anchored protein n=1 Tax=Virgibacillus subterraneus TaxID=621109 RepID=A0A1H9IQB3_9BACI|nr:DUF1129 family protein [Virgibacillus subterraneus]SEQ76774.1 Uncharacterized membrane-anchored protein [Virgibacillus subterraneus]